MSYVITSTNAESTIELIGTHFSISAIVVLCYLLNLGIEYQIWQNVDAGDIHVPLGINLLIQLSGSNNNPFRSFRQKKYWTRNLYDRKSMYLCLNSKRHEYLGPE